MKLKRMHKYLGAALVLSLAVMAAGCGSKTEPAVKTESTAVSEADAKSKQSEEAVTATGVQAETSEAKAEGKSTEEEVIKAETLSEASSQLLHIISGKVTEASTNNVMIVTDKYPQGVAFSKEDAATGFSDGLLVDQEITIFYRGDIKDGDATGVTVEFLRDKRDGDDEVQVAEVTGRVQGIGMSVIAIETADGRSLSFEQDPKPVNLTTGPQEGDTITILYSYPDEGQEGAIVPELLTN